MMWMKGEANWVFGMWIGYPPRGGIKEILPHLPVVRYFTEKKRAAARLYPPSPPSLLRSPMRLSHLFPMLLLLPFIHPAGWYRRHAHLALFIFFSQNEWMSSAHSTLATQSPTPLCDLFLTPTEQLLLGTDFADQIRGISRCRQSTWSVINPPNPRNPCKITINIYSIINGLDWLWMIETVFDEEVEHKLKWQKLKWPYRERMSRNKKKS